MEPINTKAVLSQLQEMARQAGMDSSSGMTKSVGQAQGDFSQLLRQSIKTVNRRQQYASDLAKGFEQHDPNIDLAKVMIEKQKASISFEALMQVRNKLVSAYQEIMSMPL